MGKSPGKWIKTVLLGKKSSKSYLSKNAKLDEKAAAKTPPDDLLGNMELEKGTSGNSRGAYVNHGVESENHFLWVTIDDAEMTRRDQAATKAQAAFRGYLSRRAFRALKGIIRLQALIRGHLVRRQAVATLRCMHAIVKFQALARGLRVGSNSIFELEKLATNAFVFFNMSWLNQIRLGAGMSAGRCLTFGSHLDVPKKTMNMKSLKKQAGSELNIAAIDVYEEKNVISSEKTDESYLIDTRDFLESPSNITSGPNEYNPLVETLTVENDEKMENMPFSQEELSSNKNQKIRKRSLPAKQEHIENISQKNSTLPSYMAATQSAKAKLRAQEASKFSENGYIRRHSLPASSNGKLSSLSPRLQKPVQCNGKGGSKANKLSTSSRDDKFGWRR